MARGFQGPTRALMILLFVDILVLFGLCIFCLVSMLRADDTRSLVHFGVFFLACFMAMGMLKMGYFQRLDRLAILDALEEVRDRLQN